MGQLERLRTLVLLLVGVTLPIENRAIFLGEYPLTHNKAVAAILVLFVGLQWALEKRRGPADPKRLWILFFAVSLAIGAVQSYVSGVEIFETLATSSTLLLFYFVMVYSLVTRKDLDLLLASFVAGCVLTMVSGLLGFGVTTETRYGERLIGEGGGANLLTFNLLIAISVAASFFYTSQRLAVRLVLLSFIGLMTAGVMFTLTRTAYLAFPAMLSFWGFRFRRGSYLKYAIPALLLILLPVLFAPQGVVERFRDLVTAESMEALDRSARTRFDMVPQVLEAFASNPVTGVGLNGWTQWAYEHRYRAAAIHNAYLQVLVENGLLGFIPFVMIIVTSWRELSRTCSVARRRRSLGDHELEILGIRSAFLQAAFVGTLVMGLAQPSNRHKGFWLLFVVSTVVWGLLRDRIRRPEPVRPAPQQWRWPLGSPGGHPLPEVPRASDSPTR